MSILLYNISLFFYRLGIWMAAPFNAKAKQWLDGRKDWQHKIEAARLGSGKRVWIHCASLGEFEQARPLIERLKQSSESSSHQIILTFFSPSGYEVRKNYAVADLVMYLPVDSAANAVAFLDLIKPDLVLFVKYEFWFHYLHELKHRHVPTVLFSGVFRSGQIFFQPYGGLFRDMLQCFTKIFVQNSASQKLLMKIGIESTVAFDTRFDRVLEVAQSRKQFPQLEPFIGRSKLFIAGSTWLKDEDLLVQCINENLLPGYKYMLAPHDIDQERIAALQKKIKAKSVLYSALGPANADAAVLIIDHVGSLSALYAYGQMAYIGGGFNVSVHNVLEAVVFGMPVIFGPNYHKSEEAKDLVKLDEAVSIATVDELRAAMQKGAKKNGVGGRDYVLERKGGTDKILESVMRLLG